MTPRSEAIAFRIWAYATPLGWDCTVNEIAEELGISWQQANRICCAKRWNTRLRHMTESPEGNYFCGRGRASEYMPHSHEVLRDLGLSHA